MPNASCGDMEHGKAVCKQKPVTFWHLDKAVSKALGSTPAAAAKPASVSWLIIQFSYVQNHFFGWTYYARSFIFGFISMD